MSDDLSKVDWGKPIEAYHEDGRVVAMRVAGPVQAPSDDIAKRMEALVRQMAVFPDLHQQHHYDEARAIVALLPEPVDADEQYARDLIQDHGWSDMGNIGIEAVTIMIAKAHREGRALERDSREG